MRFFFVFSFFYAVFKLSLVIAWHGHDVEFLVAAVNRSIAFAGVLWLSLKKFVIPLMIFTFVVGWRAIYRRLGGFGYAVAGTVFIQLGFSFTRGMISKIVPYYADVPLAEFDRWLHLGVDPWEFLFIDGAARLSPAMSSMIYIKVWTIVAILFPVFLALTDPDRVRTRRFMTIYIFCWVGIGAVLATLGSSVGPVFYDRLLGGDRFAELTAALDSSGLARSGFGYTQQYLWSGYAHRTSALGSGMSAFPSVHVAIATLFAVYLGERWIWTVPAGMLFVATVVVISVASGYHYAIDGYASILLVLAGWALSRRLSGRRLLVAERAAEAG